MATNYKIVFSFFIILGVVGSFTSCIKDYDPGFSEHVSKLAVNSIFSSDSVFVVQVSQSKSTVDSSTLEYLPGATVELFEDGNKIETLTEQVRKDTTYSFDYEEGIETFVVSDVFHYESTMKPVAEKTYSIRVSKEGFETVTAESSVPKGIQGVSLITDELRTTEEVYEGGFTYSNVEGPIFIDVADELGVANFYEFKLFYLYTDSIFTFDEENQELIFEGVRNNRYRVYTTISDGSGNVSQSDELSFDAPLSQFSDVRFDGKTNRFKIDDINLGYSESNNFALELEVAFISEEYYNYFTSYEKYRQNEGNFLAEPVIVFNNIENGFGVFAGYQSVVFPIEF